MIKELLRIKKELDYLLESCKDLFPNEWQDLKEKSGEKKISYIKNRALKRIRENYYETEKR